MSYNLGPQFDPSQVGPGRARQMGDITRSGRSAAELRRRQVEGHQGQLFEVGHADFTTEPHTQTRAQFAADPRTWWHGRHSEQLPSKAGEARNAGIHFGTLASAHQRKQKLGPTRSFRGKEKEPQFYRFFPVRLTGSAANTPHAPGHDQGQQWREHYGIHYYRNEVEDPGHVSAKAPSRESVLTHGDFIKQARAGAKLGLNKPVDPMIEWEAKQYGRRQYDPSVKTGEEILHRQPKSWEGPQQGQLFNTAQFFENPGMRRNRMAEEARKDIERQKTAHMYTPEFQAAHEAKLKAKYPHLYKD